MQSRKQLWEYHAPPSTLFCTGISTLYFNGIQWNNNRKFPDEKQSRRPRGRQKRSVTAQHLLWVIPFMRSRDGMTKSRLWWCESDEIQIDSIIGKLFHLKWKWFCHDDSLFDRETLREMKCQISHRQSFFHANQSDFSRAVYEKQGDPVTKTRHPEPSKTLTGDLGGVGRSGYIRGYRRKTGCRTRSDQDAPVKPKSFRRWRKRYIRRDQASEEFIQKDGHPKHPLCNGARTIRMRMPCSKPSQFNVPFALSWSRRLFWWYGWDVLWLWSMLSTMGSCVWLDDEGIIRATAQR